MKKVIAIVLLLLFNAPILYAYNTDKYWELTWFEKRILNLWDNTCTSYKQSDIPTIFIPWILASWYQEEWYEKNKIKRWLPDPITHTYDPLFFTFKRNGYTIKDVFYKWEYDLEIKGNPRAWFYLFWYDWKKDNKITASLLTKLYGLILEKYEKFNWCNIWKVNIIAHSMWWLVARSMLENMCVDLNKITNNKIKWKINKSKIISCENPYSSNTIWKNIVINNLITVSTPHRWSPKTLPLWEKWNITTTDWFWTGNWLKYKLWLFWKSDEALYKIIHAYDNKISNWIITIGQLLPDIINNNKYNNNLLYLNKGNIKIDKYNYPKNSFLEELNKRENINKIFNKVSWKYISYYSNVTWNNGLNNIIWYNLKDKKLSYKWKDIYYKYKEKINKNNYSISKIHRDNSWKWWDWTVPSLNLRLVPNDSISGEEIKNIKFKSEEIKCNWNFLYENLWLDTENEICSHSNMITASSYKILKDILWKENTYNKYNHRLSLLYNLWYTNYKDSIMDNNFNNKNFIPATIKNKAWKTKYSLKLWSNFNIMTYEILSPINVIIEDNMWRKIWVDPQTWMIINEIPWAFTSWNTEGSGESEFFYIPVKENEKFKINTTWTWDWKYHIVYKELNIKTNKITWNSIVWNAKENFWENYILKKEKKNFSVKNITKEIPTKLEVEKNIKTSNKNYKLRYFIRWNSEKVNYIQSRLLSNTWVLIKENILKIKWELNLLLEKIWKYKLELTLLDENFDNIKSPKSFKEISIERINIKKIESFLIKKYLSQEKIIYFENKYNKKIQNLEKDIKKMSFYKRNKLKIYIQNNKNTILNKIKSDSIKNRYIFFLDKIIEIIINNN